jgi:hypothetical protein
MTVQAKPNSVTTGPIIGSQKIYSAPVALRYFRAVHGVRRVG